MGERTQLLVNVVDGKGNHLLGTVLHYQWGCGRVMLMDALHLAINLPWSYRLADKPNDPSYAELDTALKDIVQMPNPEFARNLAEWLDDHSEGDLYYPFNQRDLLKDYRQIGDSDSLEKFLENLDAYYNFMPDELKGLDNNCGYMIMNVVYDDGHDTEINFEFKGGTEHGYLDGETLSFEEFCKSQDSYTHGQMKKCHFAESYKNICDSYGIELNKPKSLKIGDAINKLKWLPGNSPVLVSMSNQDIPVSDVFPYDDEKAVSEDNPLGLDVNDEFDDYQAVIVSDLLKKLETLPKDTLSQPLYVWDWKKSEHFPVSAFISEQRQNNGWPVVTFTALEN